MYEDFGKILINGGNRGLGLGFVKQLLSQAPQKIFATYRSAKTAKELLELAANNPRVLIPILADSTCEEDVSNVAKMVSQETSKLDLVINCVGYLHNVQHGPEKSLRQINANQLLESAKVNALPTLLLAKYFQKLLKHDQPSVFSAISARVGSIEDNRMGGWYSYRGSKAMLNMMISNIAIEFHRTNPNTKVLALHPGTVSTRLSEPFSKNLAPEKLFSIDYSVNCLLDVIKNTEKKPRGGFYAWDGEEIAW